MENAGKEVYVRVRYTDGSVDIVPFASRYLADLYLAYIPIEKMAGNLSTVASAIIVPIKDL